ncbi:MAG: thiamine-phosphate kinase [Pseudomonadales bacterium]
MPSEFDLIRRHFLEPAFTRPHVLTSIGDDCALLDALPENHALAISTDTLVSGVHFLESASPDLIASRAMRVSISDLAAMGAAPYGFTLALSVPDFDEEWISGFAGGVHATARAFDIPLIGGDTTRGPLTITVTVLGKVDKGAALRRNGAKLGDAVFVTGSLGDGAAALTLLQTHKLEENPYLHERYYQPDVDLVLGKRLSKLANSAIDVSDGLLADLQHILSASGVGAELKLESLPIAKTTATLAANTAQSQEWALIGGDDYRLCVTMPAEAAEDVSLADNQLIRIGTIVAETGIRLLDACGDAVELPHTLGYDHVH